MATPKRKTPNLHVVTTGPVLDEMERVLTEAAKQTAPMISRAGLIKQKAEAEVKALEAERAGVEGRRELARRHFEALMTSFDREVADIDRAIGLHTGGLTQDTLAAAE